MISEKKYFLSFQAFIKREIQHCGNQFWRHYFQDDLKNKWLKLAQVQS